LTARLILGSSSPRRLDILQSIGLPPDVVIGADIDETPLKDELPSPYVLRIAKGKSVALVDQFPNDYIISADTTCAVGRRILAKPEDIKDAERMLRLLSGRNHRIITAVVVRAPDGRTVSRINETRLKVKRLSEEDLKMLLAEGSWEGRAGAYHLLGAFARFVQKITGSSSGVLGLPAYETSNLLTGLGYKGSAHAANQA
jgi:septum formation protein